MKTRSCNAVLSYAIELKDHRESRIDTQPHQEQFCQIVDKTWLSQHVIVWRTNYNRDLISLVAVILFSNFFNGLDLI